jgi:hypothetical protein
MLEGGPVRATVRHSTALALSNHDKESFNFGVMAEQSVLPLTC